MLLGRTSLRVSRLGLGAMTWGEAQLGPGAGWRLEDPSVLPIPGAKNAAQARTDAGALAFSLEPAERDALSAVSVA